MHQAQHSQPHDHFDLTDRLAAPVTKPADLIEIIDRGELSLIDRKLFNVLLALSCDQSPDHTGPFIAPAASVRRAMGQMTAESNTRLRASLERLCRVEVGYPRLGDEFAGPLLASATIPASPAGLTSTSARASARNMA